MREPDLLGNHRPDIHRALPQSSDAEQGVLSSFLLAPREVGSLCDEKQIHAAHFHLPAHALIYDELKFLYDEKEPIDFITLTQRLRNQGRLDQAGGAAFVTDLFTFLPTAANAGYYLDILQEKFTLREIIKVCTEYAARSYDEQDDVPNILHQLEVKVMQIAKHRTRKARHKAGDIAREIFEEWKACDTKALFGIPTGIESIDAEIGGIAPGDLIVISGPTSSGKTALAMKIEASFLRRSIRVMDATFEMTAKQKVKRLMQSIAGHNLRATMKIQREFGDVTEKAFAEAASKIAAFPLEIFDDRGSTIQQVCAYARNLHSESPLGLVCLDYDELVKSERKRGEGKEEEIAAISANMKTLAGELECPCLLLSQQTTDSKGHTKLRWSSAKQNDANILFQISTSEDGKTATVLIAKNRDGARGAELEFIFEGHTTSFREA